MSRQFPEHFDATTPAPVQVQWEILAKFHSPADIARLKTSGLNVVQVQGMIQAHYREIMNQFPVGRTVITKGFYEGTYVIQQYRPEKPNYDVQLLDKKTGKSRNINLYHLAEATLVAEMDAMGSRAVGWDALRDQVRNIARKMIQHLSMPLDLSQAVEWAVKDVMKKLTKGKSITSTDAPEATDEEIRQQVTAWIQKKYDK